MDAKQFKREAWLYRALPVIAMVVLLWVFVLAQKLADNNQVGLFSALTAGALVMWRCKISATRLESWRCPQCGQRMRRGTSWMFPPKKCPNCGEPTPR